MGVKVNDVMDLRKRTGLPIMRCKRLLEEHGGVEGAIAAHRRSGAEEIPDDVIDFTDIGYIVDAFRGNDYPFDGPDECP